MITILTIIALMVLAYGAMHLCYWADRDAKAERYAKSPKLLAADYDPRNDLY